MGRHVAVELWCVCLYFVMSVSVCDCYWAVTILPPVFPYFSTIFLSSHDWPSRLACVCVFPLPLSSHTPQHTSDRTRSTGAGASRTTRRPSAHGTPGASRKTRSLSGRLSWSGKTQRFARRWPTWGKSWAAAETSSTNTRVDMETCEPKEEEDVGEWSLGGS